MASVKIDLGFGEQAVLSERAGSGIPTAKHQRDAEEFLRRWPRTRSIEQESNYLRQLGLHLGHTQPGAKSSDTSEQLRAAVKSGKVTVVIERAPASTGGGVSASQPTSPPYPLKTWGERAARKEAQLEQRNAAWEQSAVASAPPSSSMTAGDLVALLTYVKTGDVGQLLNDYGNAADDSSASTPLGDADPFSFATDPSSDDVMTVAARGVSEQDEGECYEEYERDMDLCNALGGPMGGARGLALCQQNAFLKYQQCRGF